MLGQQEIPRCLPAQVVARSEQPLRMNLPYRVGMRIILARLDSV